MKKSPQKKNMCYVYYYWDAEKRKDIPLYLMPGENKATDDLIIVLSSFEHDERLSKRYNEEHADYNYRNYLSRITRGDSTAINPIDTMLCNKWFASSAASEQEHLEKVDRIRRVLENLTEGQLNLVYEIYGAGHKQNEIAERLGKTPQAINNRLKKIKARIKKLMAEQGVDLCGYV